MNIQVPANSVASIKTTMTLDSTFIKLKARRKYQHTLTANGNDEVSGTPEQVQELTDWVDKMIEQNILKNPIGPRSFNEGRFHLRTSDDHANQIIYIAAWLDKE